MVLLWLNHLSLNKLAIDKIKWRGRANWALKIGLTSLELDCPQELSFIIVVGTFKAERVLERRLLPLNRNLYIFEVRWWVFI